MTTHKKKGQTNPEIRPLFIHYYFPPRGGVAVQRFVKFIKYLTRLGCVPTVLTSGARYETSDIYDENMFKDIPPEVIIYRTSPEKIKQGQFIGRFRYYLIDRFLPWVLPAYIKALRIIKKHDINLIFVTSPPHSQQLIGWLLKRKTGLPWVADFRDPWLSDRRFRMRKTKPLLYIEEKVERALLKNANTIIGVTPSAVDNFKRKGDSIGSSASFYYIPNGYDPEDYTRMQEKENGCLTIAYVGSFDKVIVDPIPFFAALHQLCSTHPKIEREVRIRLIGSYDLNDLAEKVRTYNIEGIVEIVGFTTHREAIRIMKKADVLLLILTDSEMPSLIIPSKLFEYIGARKPILALLTEGDTADFIRKYKLGTVVPPTDTKAIARAIYEYYTRYTQGTLKRDYSPPPEFSRAETAKKLLAVFQETLGRQG